MLSLVLSACSPPASTPEVLAETVFNSISPGETHTVEFEIPANRPVLVLIQGWGTEFSSTLTIPDSHHSMFGIEWLRLAPHFHLLPPQSSRSRAKLVIVPKYAIIGARLEARVLGLSAESRSDRQQAEALAEVNRALDEESGLGDWNERIALLQTASVSLAKTGSHEWAMWAEFYAAFLAYWHPFDLVAAIHGAEKILANGHSSDFPQLRLAVLQLLGASLIERADEPADIALAKFQRGQEILREADRLALELDRPFEHVSAINNSGIGYYYQDQYENSLRQYNAALSLAESLGDEWLERIILGNRAVVAEALGQYFSAIDSLLDVNARLRENGDAVDLADNLRELGRIHRRMNDYTKAIPYLVEANALYEQEGDQAGLARTHASLGIGYRSIGRLQQARVQMELAAKLSHESNSGNGLNGIYKTLADIARQEGRFGDMQLLRQKQLKYMTSKFSEADYNHALALDQLALADRVGAKATLEKCVSLSEGADTTYTSDLCTLQLAFVRMEAGDAEGAPQQRVVEQSFQKISATGPKFMALGARFLMAQILNLSGKQAESLRLSTELVGEMRNLRQHLPGVMGAWYWESRSEILQFHLDRVMESNPDNPAGYLANLHTLDGLRNLEMNRTHSGQTEMLRGLVAQRDRTEESRDRLEINNRIDALMAESLAGGGTAVDEVHPGPSSDVRLGANEAFLTFHFGPVASYVWFVDANGVSQHELEVGEGFTELVASTRSAFRTVGAEQTLMAGLDQLGKVLLDPIAGRLPHRLYFQSGGVLTGFPLDALRMDGHYLLEQHEVINVFSLAALTEKSAVDQQQIQPGRLLLAGNPDTANSGLAALPGTQREIAAIQAQFDGADILSLLGPNLTRDHLLAGLGDSRDLIHIASHATLDLEYPELSQIILSSDTDDVESGRLAFLTPADLGGVQLDNALVVLSACNTAGNRQFEFDPGLGFVTDFLRQGAGVVVASLWPVDDQLTSDLMAHFYRNIAQGASPISALRSARLGMWHKSKKQNIGVWNGFQVFAN